MEILSSIGERLREVRQAMGMTQEQFAAIAQKAGAKGVTRQSQSNYEKGQQSPTAPYWAAIGAAGADLKYILTGIRSPAATVEPLAPGIAAPLAAYAADGLVITNKREIALIENYRACAEEGKDATERVALVAKKAQHQDVIAHTKRHAKGGDQ